MQYFCFLNRYSSSLRQIPHVGHIALFMVTIQLIYIFLLKVNLYLLLWRTWYPTNVCTDGFLHGGIEALQCHLQGIRCHVRNRGGVGWDLDFCGSHTQLQCQPLRVTQHQWVQLRHGDTVQEHLQVLENGGRESLTYLNFKIEMSWFLAKCEQN